VSCSNDCATIESYIIPLLESSYGNIPSCSWPNHSSDVANVLQSTEKPQLHNTSVFHWNHQIRCDINKSEAMHHWLQISTDDYNVRSAFTIGTWSSFPERLEAFLTKDLPCTVQQSSVGRLTLACYDLQSGLDDIGRRSQRGGRSTWTISQHSHSSWSTVIWPTWSRPLLLWLIWPCFKSICIKCHLTGPLTLWRPLLPCQTGLSAQM